jgi:hypothetical protein
MAGELLCSVEGIQTQLADMMAADREKQGTHYHVNYDVLRARLAEIVAGHTVSVSPMDKTPCAIE